jgi:hypothetical protein
MVGEKKNSSAFFEIDQLRKAGLGEKKHASAFFDLPRVSSLISNDL